MMQPEAGPKGVIDWLAANGDKLNHALQPKHKWDISDKISSILADKINFLHMVDCSAILNQELLNDPVNAGLKNRALFVVTGEIIKLFIMEIYVLKYRVVIQQ